MLEHPIDEFMRIGLKGVKNIQQFDQIETPSATLVLGDERLCSPEPVSHGLLMQAELLAEFAESGGDGLITSIMNRVGRHASNSKCAFRIFYMRIRYNFLQEKP